MYMKQPALTKWQRRNKALLDEAFLNPDFYQELGYVRRDYFSALALHEPEMTFDERLLRVMVKYKVPVDCFEVLSKFCTEGGELDYFLIHQLKDSQGHPKIKSKPRTKLHWDIYKMSIQQLMSISQIVDSLREQDRLHGLTRIDDINLVSHIVRRMNDGDTNRGRSYLPKPGKRQKM